MGSIPVLDAITHQLDLGFSQLFEHSFFVTEIDYGILGADFLSRHSLWVDMSTKRLLRLPEVERCCLFQNDNHKKFSPSSPCTSKDTFMAELLLKFPEVFEPLKRSRVVKHSVVAKVETVTETPVWSSSQRLAPDKLAAVRLEINRLISSGILAKSHSEWSSPIVMVKKANGQYRLCADFVSLNKVLKKIRYPLPNIHDFSVMSSGCSIFSCIDIVDAYYQIPVDPSCSHKLTITTPIGCYRYLYLPMGLATSSNYFQSLMHEVLSDIPGVFVYLDDIFLMS